MVFIPSSCSSITSQLGGGGEDLAGSMSLLSASRSARGLRIVTNFDFFSSSESLHGIRVTCKVASAAELLINGVRHLGRHSPPSPDDGNEWALGQRLKHLPPRPEVELCRAMSTRKAGCH